MGIWKKFRKATEKEVEPVEEHELQTLVMVLLRQPVQSVQIIDRVQTAAIIKYKKFDDPNFYITPITLFIPNKTGPIYSMAEAIAWWSSDIDQEAWYDVVISRLQSLGKSIKGQLPYQDHEWLISCTINILAEIGDYYEHDF